jgi:RimJ/RimL family protein N-acetyltransferase
MDQIGYEDWLAAYWHRPDLDRALTTVAVVDGVVAAFSLALTDGADRYQSGMTGTRRAYRGRGLARLVKHASLRRAGEAGYRYAYTGNDAENPAMLAINHWFGYRMVGTEWRYLRELCR